MGILIPSELSLREGALTEPRLPPLHHPFPRSFTCGFHARFFERLREQILFDDVLFLYQKEKERKRSWQACGLTARANPMYTTQSPMKLRTLRSSVLCGNPYPVRAFASRGYADGASDSPTPSSFPSFICLQIPCSFFYGNSLINKNLSKKVNPVALHQNNAHALFS